MNFPSFRSHAALTLPLSLSQRDPERRRRTSENRVSGSLTSQRPLSALLLASWAVVLLQRVPSFTHAFVVVRVPPLSFQKKKAFWLQQRSMVLRDSPPSWKSSSDNDAAAHNNDNPNSTSFLLSENDDEDPDRDDEHDFMIWKVNASDAFGSMLLQMQSTFQLPEEQPTPIKQQQQQQRKTASLPNTDPRSPSDGTNTQKVAKKVDPTGGGIATKKENPNPKLAAQSSLGEKTNETTLKQQQATKESTKKRPKTTSKDAEKAQQHVPLKLFSMTLETAKELDDAIVIKNIPNHEHEMIEVMQVPSFLYTTITTDPISTTPEQQEGKAELARDVRQLAVSIASRAESVEDWCRVVSPQIRGIHPLLETIRYGARYVTAQTVDHDDDAEESLWEEASRACRALRDLCALSPELAAVLVDSMLRANVKRNGGFLQDLCFLLDYANRKIAPAKAVTKGPRQWLLRNLRRRHRRKQRLGGLVSPTTPSQETSSAAAAADSITGDTTADDHAMATRGRRQGKYCQLYVNQLLLAMAVASDDAVHAIRSCPQLKETVLQCSSFAKKERRRRWLRYPYELGKWMWYKRREKRRKSGDHEPAATDDEITENTSEEHRHRRPFLEAASPANDLHGEICKTANQVLAAIGYNQWIPKIPGQRGLRILTMDGGGSRGMCAVTMVRCLVEAAGPEVCESFDMICGTSTGAIIAFLTGLRQESSAEAVARYGQLIKQIFVKSALSTPLMLFTTASYDESPFMGVLSRILKDGIMLDCRSDPATPLVFAVTSKMSSTPTHVALFRNYNYASGELPDPFTVQPDDARVQLELPLDAEHPDIRDGKYISMKDKINGSLPGQRHTAEGSRHPGSFRVLQRYALRASTAAPTFFKPVMMGGEMYCDGGMVTSNPTAVAIHEARTLFPDIPIELVVSIGTGAFYEQKSAPRIGWDGIIGQIVNSATDGEQVHHILEDILGDPGGFGHRLSVSGTRYYRFNPVIGYPDEFPIDVTEPKKLEKLKKITKDYMNEPAQRAKLEEIADVLKGQNRFKVHWPRK